MPKLITVRCHEPMALDKHYRQPWSDVFISFTGKPGRKRYEFIPTLVARPGLEDDLQSERRLQQKYPEEETYASGVESLEQIVELFNSGAELYIDTRCLEGGFPTIYTSKEYIDRAEAERMLIPYLKTLGFSEVRFKWTRPKFTFSPT